MVIKVYVSNCSGNMEIKKQQKRILEILQGKRIEFEEIDISDPASEEDKLFMRANSQAKEGQRNPLPPQIFADNDYCGDYELFQEAAEFEELFEFLKLAPQKSVSTAAVSVTVTEMNGQTNGHTNGFHDNANGNASSDKEDEEDAASDAEAEKKEESDLESDNIVLDMAPPQDDSDGYQQQVEEKEEEEEEEKNGEEETRYEKDEYDAGTIEKEASSVSYSQVSSTKTDTAQDDDGGYTVTTTMTTTTRTTRQGGDDDEEDDVDRDDEASSSTHDYENVVIVRDCDNNTVVQVKEDEAPVESQFPEESEQANGNDDGFGDQEEEREDEEDK